MKNMFREVAYVLYNGVYKLNSRNSQIKIQTYSFRDTQTLEWKNMMPGICFYLFFIFFIFWDLLLTIHTKSKR